MAREHHMVRYWREVREIADEEGISVEEARGRWSDIYVRVGVRREGVKKRIQNIAIALTATAASTYCPFCRDDLGVEDLHTCTRCNTRFHNECWGELGENCTTLGCAARRHVIRFAQRPMPAPTHAPLPSEQARLAGELCRTCGRDGPLQAFGGEWLCEHCAPRHLDGQHLARRNFSLTLGMVIVLAGLALLLLVLL